MSNWTLSSVPALFSRPNLRKRKEEEEEGKMKQGTIKQIYSKLT